MIRPNKNPLPGYFGNITPADMDKITSRYNELSRLAENIQLKNKEKKENK